MKQTKLFTKSSFLLSPIHSLACRIKKVSNYYPVIFITGISLLNAGCKQNGVNTKTVPFKAEFETVYTITQQGPPETDLISGEGYSTPMEKSSFVAHAQFDANGNLAGKIVAITANGDKIFATIQGHAPAVDANGDITLHFDSVITGGEGKFTNAKGTFSGIAHENTYTTGGSVSWDGTISY